MKKGFIAIVCIYLVIRIISSCSVKGLYEDGLNQSLSDSAKLNIPYTIEPFDLDIMPPSLGVQFYRDGIIFLADSKNEEKISSGHVSFGTLQAYYASFKDTLGQHIIFSPKPIFQYPCDALTFSSDFGTMYYTKTVGKEPREKIFRAENFMIGEARQMWTFDAEPLTFCKEESIYSHPALSVDGSFMIFASDMKGSLGGMDLFITRNVDMRWSEPESLGKFLNTKGNDIFPVLDRNNNLFFSSNGRKGPGGYDIFICKYNGKGWDIPIRLTNSINTKNDEFAFTIDRLTGNSAFYTSMKASKNAELQLYRISPNRKVPSAKNADLTALLLDMSASNIDSAEIKLMLKQLEAEKMRADSIEAARIKAERLTAEKRVADSIAAVKLAAKKLEDDRLLAEKQRKEGIALAALTAQQLASDRKKAEKMRSDSIAAAKLTAQKLEADRLKAEKLRKESITAAALTATMLEANRLKAEKRKSDSIAAAKLATQKIEADRLKAEQLKAEKRKTDSIAAVKLATQKLEAERLKAEKRKSDSIAFAKLSVQKQEAERIKALNKRKADSLEAERLKTEKLKAERLSIERFKADSLAAARLKENERLKKDEVYYKVQILSSVKPRGDFEVTINGIKYKAVQYFYLKEYRYVIGAFRSVDPARELQNKARSSGWPQAFVAAFKNGERSLDKELFK